MPVQNAEIGEMFDQTAELLEIERLPKSITSLLKAGEDFSNYLCDSAWTRRAAPGWSQPM